MMRTTRVVVLLAALLVVSACARGGGGGAGTTITRPTLSLADVSTTEGTANAKTLDFTVTLSSASQEKGSVKFATADGTATAGSDYKQTSGTLDIPLGVTQLVISVPVLVDAKGERDETLSLTLSEPQGVKLGSAVATGTLTNDDAPDAPVVTVADGGIKTIRFSWAAVEGATAYRLLEDPTGSAGFTQVGADLPATATQLDHPVSVHRTNWLSARFQIAAVNAIGQTPSAPQAITPLMIAAIAYVKASNTDGNDNFGFSVALAADGNTLAVGALREASRAIGIDGIQADNSLSSAGAVYVFRRSGTTWAQEAYVKASNTDGDDLFGSSVALAADGNTLAVGAEGEASLATGIDGNQADNSLSSAGAVYVFRRSGTTWAQEAYVKASNTDAGDLFGHSVALTADGKTLAVGAWGERSFAIGIDGNQADNSLTSAGAVYVFRRSGTTWAQEAYVKASNTDADDLFGHSVALAADGETLAVGAASEDSRATGVDANQTDNTASGAGAVYVFRRSGTTWAQEAYVKASNTDGGDLFGQSVALAADGNTLAVGALGEDSRAIGIDGILTDNSLTSAGAVYVFRRSGTTWAQEAYVKASNTDARDFFGQSVALAADGNTLAVGAEGEASRATGIDGDQTDNNAFPAGAVYVFRRSGTTWAQEAYVKASNTGLDDFGFSVALAADGNTLAVGASAEASRATGIDGDQNDNGGSLAGAVYLY